MIVGVRKHIKHIGRQVEYVGVNGVCFGRSGRRFTVESFEAGRVWHHGSYWPIVRVREVPEPGHELESGVHRIVGYALAQLEDLKGFGIEVED
tara:strand:+ start:685 stop:963 length:279 start_codon:yes stop_codon:yes gene_type:complete